MGWHWDEDPKVLVFYCQWGKLFAINLLLTTKQYKVDNIVYYGETPMRLSPGKWWLPAPHKAHTVDDLGV